jgi:RNA-directed DNA polymerase
MNTAPVPMYAWNTIPWARAEREVFKLQKRIYQAAQRENRKAIHQ